MVLRDKAEAITEMLFSNDLVGHGKQNHISKRYVASKILESLKKDGNFQLLENDGQIEVKTIIRNKNTVSGVQG